MPKLPLAATAIASILVTLATGSVAQTLSPNLPLAIICFNEKTQTWRIGYLDVAAPDGPATYVAGGSLGYGECQGPGATALQSLSRRRLLRQDLG